MTIHAPTLQNEHVTLEPMTPDHAAAMFEAFRDDPETFRYFSRVPTPWSAQGMREQCEYILGFKNLRGYTVFDRASGRVVGSSTYCDIREANRGVEIGWTWYAPSARGTPINPACKLLLMTHAFEGGLFSGGGSGGSGGAIRVQLKTDERNAHSRRAIEKLGARFEGILRDHVIMPDGHLRQSAMYSVTRGDWPGVRAGLESRLAT